ncbi:MAG: hypothetical protein KJ957_07445 [Candidatus Omnitrophica bacterium]|nr:hypothetical protein [Candidatus Omnitrophota bacterium]
MERFGIIVLTLGMVCLLVTSANAAPVGLPTNVKEMEGQVFTNAEDDVEFSMAVEADFLDKRELENANSEIQAAFYAAKFICSFEDKVDLYMFLGQSQGMECKATISSSEVVYKLDDNLFWGIGINTFIHDWLRYGLRFFADAKYRRVKDIGYASVTVDGFQYDENQIKDPRTAFDWNEWQIAFGVAKDLDYIMPYAGVRYSDVSAECGATVGGTTYDLGSTGSDNIIGFFIGCSFVPTEQFSVDLEARFVDEQAVTVAGVVTF